MVSGRQDDHLRGLQPRDREHRRGRTGTATTLYSDPANTFYSPTWSPDGKNLAYTELDNQGTLTQLFVNGKAVSGNEDVFAFPARWASNDTLIYAANGKILAAQPVQRRGEDDPVLGEGDVQPCLLSDEAPQLLVDHEAAGHRHPQPRAVAGRKPRRVRRAEPAVGDEDRAQARRADATPRSPRRLLPGRPTVSSWRTRRTRVDRWRSSSATWIPVTRRLTAPFTGAQVKAAWSPDGKKIAFVSALDTEAGSQAMYVADVATGKFHRSSGPTNAKGAAVRDRVRTRCADLGPGQQHDRARGPAELLDPVPRR